MGEGVNAEKDPGLGARPSTGKGGGQPVRQWPGLGHAECYVCRLSEKSPSKAVTYMT